MALSYIEELGRILKEKPKLPTEQEGPDENEENSETDDIITTNVKTEKL